MNVKIQNQIPKENKPVISSITFYEDRNFVMMNDSDSQTDYFNSASLTTKHLIEWLTTESGYGAGEVVQVEFINNEELPQFHKRLKRIAKAINYNIATKEQKGIYRISENSKECFIRPYAYNQYKIYDPNLITENKIIW